MEMICVISWNCSWIKLSFSLPLGWLQYARGAIIDHKGDPYVLRKSKEHDRKCLLPYEPRNLFSEREIKWFLALAICYVGFSVTNSRASSFILQQRTHTFTRISASQKCITNVEIIYVLCFLFHLRFLYSCASFTDSRCCQWNKSSSQKRYEKKTSVHTFTFFPL